MLQVTTEASRGLKHLLEEEWQFVKEITPHIRSAEAEAGRRFWYDKIKQRKTNRTSFFSA